MTTTQTIFHRYNRNNSSPFNDRLGYGMFAEKQYRVEDCYGPCHWVFSGETISVADVIAAADAAGFEDEFGFEASCLDPKDIVDSAEGWDDLKIVSWVWENVCEARNWLAIETQDGAILFDATLATYAD